MREPPPMRVVTKGWWTLREERVDMATLARQDADERRHMQGDGSPTALVLGAIVFGVVLLALVIIPAIVRW